MPGLYHKTFRGVEIIMQELEKILEEIKESSIIVATSKEHYIHPQDGRFVEEVVLLDCVEDIIRKHMNDGWIPVEKALPPEPPEYVDDEDDLEQYIVMIEGAERPTTLRYAGDGTWWEDGTYYPVIAWRPLPEPYRPERSMN